MSLMNVGRDALEGARAVARGSEEGLRELWIRFALLLEELTILLPSAKLFAQPTSPHHSPKC